MIHRIWNRLLIELTPSCERVTRILSESQERPLSRWERLGLAAHYRICSWCHRYQRQLALLRSVARKAGAQGIGVDRVLSERAKARIARTLRDAPSGRQSTPQRSKPE